MSSLPGGSGNPFDFPKAEEGICDKWSKESTFKTQNRLSEERGDEVRFPLPVHIVYLSACYKLGRISLFRFIYLFHTYTYHVNFEMKYSTFCVFLIDMFQHSNNDMNNKPLTKILSFQH